MVIDRVGLHIQRFWTGGNDLQGHVIHAGVHVAGGGFLHPDGRILFVAADWDYIFPVFARQFQSGDSNEGGGIVRCLHCAYLNDGRIVAIVVLFGPKYQLCLLQIGYRWQHGNLVVGII